MQAACEQCGYADTVEEVVPPSRVTCVDPPLDPTHCRCFECGAEYTFEADADCDEDGYFDASGPGELLRAGDPDAIARARADLEARS